MESPDPFDTPFILINDIKCDTFENVISALNTYRPALCAILKEVYHKLPE